MNLEQRLENYLSERKSNQTYRQLYPANNLIDFTSNDYLGIAKSAWVKQQIQNELKLNYQYHPIGATGSRLLNGNNELYVQLEAMLASFHHAEAALMFNSGYNANVGLIGTIARKNDIIFYDELVHASIHQGIKMSEATAIPFKHNDIDDVQKKIKAYQTDNTQFIITESLFSMDGDIAPLADFAAISKQYNAQLIVDEAHATGIFGKKGSGLCHQLDIENECFARVYTFGKAMGTHGAVVVGSTLLKNYLINYSKPFIYSTALNLYDLLSIKVAYQYIASFSFARNRLFNNISYFNSLFNLDSKVEGPIFYKLFRNATDTKAMAKKLYECGIDAKAITYPTVAKGKERIRIVMHSYNTTDELNLLYTVLK